MKQLVSLLMFFLLVSCSREAEVKPIRQDIQELVFASGQLEWDDSYNLIAQTDGVLEKVVFEAGQTVTKGMVIAAIDNKVNQINAESAQEQLVISKENVTANAPALLQLEQNIQFAESKYLQDKKQAERYERLQQNNIGSKVEYENAQLAAKNSLANLKALKKQYDQVLQQAKQQLIATNAQLKSNQVLKGYNSVVVAESGTVVKKYKNNGDYVKKGDLIATIGNQQKVEAVLNVDENSIGKVKLGQTVYVKLNTDKTKVYNGKITEILSAFDTQSQSFICKVTFNESLSHSLFGTQLEANVLVSEKKNALLIPRNYLGFGNKVNVKDKEETVILKTGIISTEYVEVLSGIEENDILLPLKP
ncbi:efflux RND transporter periplasmic adaptor subunit [Flavobacterium sp. TBRC 19031]|uniref:efflux RND transporter periplasmic adaptor subunit n=1 Tax=Flavobacterium mekongense TaxID=3379707 RepID=UPI00399B261E